MWHRMKPEYEERDHGIVGPNEGSQSSIDAIQQEQETFTGLYNASGQPLHRQKEILGFIKS